MEIVKIIAVKFKPQPRFLKNCLISFGEMILEFHKVVEGKDADLLVSAKKKLANYPKLTSDNYIIITRKDTRPLEYAIENTVNLFTFSEGISKSIGATTPSVVFNPETDEERAWLESTSGLLVNNNRMRFTASTNIDFEFCLKNLNDRIDGVTLISEALSSSSDTGKFHDYIRLFERAFKLSSKKLIDPLFNFLSNTDLEYKKNEIENWIQIRHAITHADLKEDFLIESDVTPVIKRIEQATYDVLLNKAIWRSNSFERRNLYKIEFGMYASNKVLITQGSEGNIAFQLLDETCSYKTMFDAVLTKLPNNWWSKKSEGFHFNTTLGKVKEK